MRFRPTRLLADLPISRKLAIVSATFTLIILGLFALSALGMTLLSGVRAYVGGEGLWSKAQKQATTSLQRYARTRDERDYAGYLQQLAVPLGDRKARLELEKPDTDFEVVYRGFIEGRNHPEDVAILARMYKRLGWVSYMRRAIDIWAQADAHIAELERVGGELHAAVSSSHASEQEVNRLLERIEAINAELTKLEDAFSYTLGEAARWLQGLLLGIMLAAMAVFLAAGLSIALLIGRRLTRAIQTLRDQAVRMAGGDFTLSVRGDSKDEIGELADTFQLMATARQRAERIKDEFFANVSHELRTPLTLILAPLESLLLNRAASMTPAERQALETMHNNSVRLYQMVTGILDFSKLEAGKLPVRRVPLDVVALTRSVVGDFHSLTKQKGLETRLHVEPCAPVSLVSIDPYLYERILFNLLSNAVKFTAAGGTVSVSLTLSNDGLCLRVTDTGIGIAPSDVATLFRKFHQLEGASTRRFEGTGLGLALVKEFAERLDGTVSVETEVGVGSCFTVECAAPRTAAAEEALPTRGRMPAQRYWTGPSVEEVKDDDQRPDLPKVLIAEDNHELGAYIAEVLREICRPRLATDGEEASSLVHAWHPDLVISDVMMPKRDGLSLCREIKASQETARIPVVLLSALTYRDALLKGWQVGADDYLYKPFHPQELLTRVRSLLETVRERRRMEQEHARFVEEHATRAAADKERRRSKFLSDASRELGASLDYEATLEPVARLAVPEIADFCAIDVKEAGEHRTLAACHALGKDHLIHESSRHSQVCVPLIARGRTLGKMTLAWADRASGADDVEIAEELARRCALAIDNARLYEGAEKAIRLRDDFLSIASHELRTPLTALQLQLQNLERAVKRDKGDERIMKKLELAGRQTTRLTKLIDSLLDVSRIAVGRLKITPEEFDFAELARDVVEQFKDEAASASCQLVVQASPPVVGRWDRLRSEQVVSNLVSNAIKYGSSNPIEVTVASHGDSVKLVIRDRGIGIAPEDAARIFERFERAEPSQHYGGLGLGLYITRQIVNAHGGSVEVASQPGQGSTFTVSMPRGPISPSRA